MMPSPIVFNVR